MSGPLRSGLGGFTGDEPAHERHARAEREWDDATLAVRDAAHVFDDVLGDRRRAEREADDQEHEQRSRSRFL